MSPVIAGIIGIAVLIIAFALLLPAAIIETFVTPLFIG